MARIVNGALYVESFNETGIVGEYTFDNALYNNQTDPNSNGAYDLEIGFVVIVPAVDRNTFTIVPGTFNRYVITDLSVIDNVRVSGTIIWDNLDEEQYAPSNGVFCIVSQTTPNLKLTIPPLDVIYTDLVPGSTASAMISDLLNIIDKLSNNSGDSNLPEITINLVISEDGQLLFSLPFTPTNPANVNLTVNGLKYKYGIGNDFIINDKTINWSVDALLLITTDNMTISYTYMVA